MTISDTTDDTGIAAQTPPGEWLASASQVAAHSVRAGQFAPTFRLPDIHGGDRALIELIEQGPLVVSFYRGAWCDFCDAALETLGSLDPAIRDLGATQVAIGPAPGDQAQIAKLAALPLPVLVDRGMKVATAYGLATVLPETLHKQYAQLGYIPTKIIETGEWKIVVPATYVIGQNGRVIIAMIDADYRNRLKPTELLPVLRGLHNRQQHL